MSDLKFMINRCGNEFLLQDALLLAVDAMKGVTGHGYLSGGPNSSQDFVSKKAIEKLNASLSEISKMLSD